MGADRPCGRREAGRSGMTESGERNAGESARRNICFQPCLPHALPLTHTHTPMPPPHTCATADLFPTMPTTTLRFSRSSASSRPAERYGGYNRLHSGCEGDHADQGVSSFPGERGGASRGHAFMVCGGGGNMHRVNGHYPRMGWLIAW